MSDSYSDYCDILAEEAAEEEKKRISSKKVASSKEVKKLVGKFNDFAESAFDQINIHIYNMNFGLLKEKIAELRDEIKDLVESLG